MISARRAALLLANAALLSCVYVVMQSPASDYGVALNTRGVPSATGKIDINGSVTTAAIESKLLFRVRPPAPATAAAPAPPVEVTPKFRLTGVVWSDREKIAIFQMFDGGKHQRVRSGEAVAGWTLRQLTPKGATIELGEKLVELRLVAQSPHLSD